jgi:hypothetical protein
MKSPTSASTMMPQSRTDRAFEYGAGLLLAGGVWFLFVAPGSLHEAALGAVSASLTVVVTSLAWRRMKLHFAPTVHQISAGWRIPSSVMRETWRVTAILAADLFGQRAGSHYRGAEFHALKNKNKGATQRILATAYTTISPNFIMIGINENKMLFHQLERSAIPKIIHSLERTR